MKEKNMANNPSCQICGNQTFPLFDDKLSLTFHQCQHCGYTFKDNQHHLDHQAEKSQYDAHENTSDNQGYVRMFERFLTHAVLPYKQTGRALEFGSGPGPVLYEMLKTRGFKTTHYDPYYHPNQSYLNNTYDLITTTEVFEHLSNPEMVFKTLVSLLKQDGILAIMTSFRPNDNDEFLSWWYRRDATHIGFFTLKSFEHLAKKHGVPIVQTNHKNTITFKKE